MKSRVISAIVIAAIFAAILYFGENAFIGASIVLAALAYKELISINKNLKLPVGIKVLGLLLVIGIILTNSKELYIEMTLEKLAFIFIIILVPTVLIKNYKANDGFYLSFVILFIATVFSLLVKLYIESVYMLLYVVIIACITDIFALFTGKLIGKHKLTKISPKKTIEGSIGGSLFAVIIGVTYYTQFIDDANLIGIILITLLLSIVGQIGDLFFSLIKRENDVKDYSNLIPGHGGILDRLDSIIFILIVYVLILQFL